MKIIYYSDDDIDDLSIFQHAISGTGYTAVVFFNGQELIETLMASPKKPNMIFLDFFMPLANGDEILRRIRSMSEYNHIPVIMITGTLSTIKLQEYIDIGASYFIDKAPSLSVYRDNLARILRIKWENYVPRVEDFTF